MSRTTTPALRPARIAARAIGAAAAAGALLLAGTADASAATRTITGGTEQAFESSLRGRGQVSTDATVVGASGKLSVEAEATAGRPLLGLFGGASSASASAGVTNFVGVSEGVYTVTFRYDDVSADPSSQGRSSASVVLDSVATFSSADETNKTPQPHIAYREVDQDGGDVVVTLEVSVPEAGSLFLVGRATASAYSNAPGANASAEASVDGITVSVTELD